MFSDPFTGVMALIILAFIGTLAVFFRIWRELDSLRSGLRDIRETLQIFSADSAQQGRDLGEVIRELRALNPGASRRDESIGELLEQGLPNLAPAPGPADRFLDDADLLRRLGDDEEKSRP